MCAHASLNADNTMESRHLATARRKHPNLAIHVRHSIGNFWLPNKGEAEN